MELQGVAVGLIVLPVKVLLNVLYGPVEVLVPKRLFHCVRLVADGHGPAAQRMLVAEPYERLWDLPIGGDVLLKSHPPDSAALQARQELLNPPLLLRRPPEKEDGDPVPEGQCGIPHTLPVQKLLCRREHVLGRMNRPAAPQQHSQGNAGSLQPQQLAVVPDLLRIAVKEHLCRQLPGQGFLPQAVVPRLLLPLLQEAVDGRIEL